MNGTGVQGTSISATEHEIEAEREDGDQLTFQIIPTSDPKNQPRFHFDSGVVEHEVEVEREGRTMGKGIGHNKVMVVAFQRGRMASTGQAVVLQKGQDLELNLEQELVDREQTYEIFDCANDDYGENACLMRCLLQKYFNEFGCIHPRLTFLPEYKSDPSFRATKKCLHKDLVNKTEDLIRERTEAVQKFGLSSNNSNAPQLEAGYVFIRNTLAGFKSEVNDDWRETRCGCRLPCLRQLIKLRTWGEPESNFDETDTKITFRINPTVRRYRYHYLHTLEDFLADIGGYSDLFLGMSLLRFVMVLKSKIKQRLHKQK